MANHFYPKPASWRQREGYNPFLTAVPVLAKEADWRAAIFLLPVSVPLRTPGVKARQI